MLNTNDTDFNPVSCKIATSSQIIKEDVAQLIIALIKSFQRELNMQDLAL